MEETPRQPDGLDYNTCPPDDIRMAIPPQNWVSVAELLVPRPPNYYPGNYGFGEHLVRQQGWEPGFGLGRNRQGILRPVRPPASFNFTSTGQVGPHPPIHQIPPHLHFEGINFCPAGFTAPEPAVSPFTMAPTSAKCYYCLMAVPQNRAVLEALLQDPEWVPPNNGRICPQCLPLWEEMYGRLQREGPAPINSPDSGFVVCPACQKAFTGSKNMYAHATAKHGPNSRDPWP